MTRTSDSIADGAALKVLAGNLLDRLRDERTRVHAITNAAAQTFTANLLLAAGGIPSLTIAPDEVPAFTSRSGALLVNLGTLDSERRAAMRSAIATARARHKPWVLDPVFVEASPTRLDFARTCLEGLPCVVRCNEAEFAALAQTDASQDTIEAFARKHRIVVALTGQIDIVTDGTRVVRIANGDPLMTRVTAMGCAATALVAAFAALHDDALEAAAAALLVTGLCGEIAAEQAAGPGSFQPIFIDILFSLAPAAIIERGKTA